MEVTSILKLGFGKRGEKAHGSNFRASVGVWTDVYMDWYQDGQFIDSHYSHTYFKVVARHGDPSQGKDLIEQYERNENMGWASIFTGEVLMESGVGGQGHRNYLCYV